MSPISWPKILEELRALAQMGLNYNTGDAYDHQRYQRLLELVSEFYALHTSLPDQILLQRFQQEIGQITPKVGVDAAIFDTQKRMLLVKRKDDLCWGLPGGWCDLNESPQQALQREVQEELSLKAEIGSLVNVFTRLPGDYASPHTSYHIVYLVHVSAETPKCQPEEILDWGWFWLHQVPKWHRDHLKFAQSALEARFA